VQAVGGDMAGDRLQIRHDDAEKPVIGEDPIRLLEGFFDLVQIEVLDAMGRPDGVGRPALDRRQIGDVGEQIGRRAGIEIDPELAPLVKHRRQPRLPLRAAAQIDQQFRAGHRRLAGQLTHAA